MNNKITRCKLLNGSMLFILTCILFASGCARYARTVNSLYEPTAAVSGGSGEVYIVIPENQQTRSPDVKWVIGEVKNDDNIKIDEVFSPRSAAEIIQTALALEFKRAGYTVISVTNRPSADQTVIDLTKTEINLEQISDLADIKATCRVLMRLDLVKHGTLVKQLQYESTSSKTDFKDRELLASSVLNDALRSVIARAMPDLQGHLTR